MKEIKMFMMDTCPHCKRALELMEEIFIEHPEYRDIPLKKIDENIEPDYAYQFDYYYVPTFYVEEAKIHEGIPSKDDIKRVFMEASA
ncbi:MAG: thioredoxin family protein [Synergistaceae bacterium]|jgi:glutaredoxin|nr:thioredoxin family protein [Synergistaceae bacterium]